MGNQRRRSIFGKHYTQYAIHSFSNSIIHAPNDINVLLPPHYCMTHLQGHLDYPRRHHIMHHGLQVIESPASDS